MYRDIIVNLAMIISILSIAGQLYRNVSLPAAKNQQFLFGILTGLLGIILMLFTIEITDTIIMDLRNFAIIIATLYGGIYSGIISGIIIALGRIVIFGINISSITALFTFISLVFDCILLVKTKLTKRQKFLWMNVSNIFIIDLALCYLVDDSEVLLTVLVQYAIISFLGGYVIQYLCEYIERSNQNFRQNILYAKVIETTQQGVSITDETGKILFINDGFTRITGYSLDEVIGKNPRMLKSGRHEASFYRNMWKDLMTSGQWRGEIWNKRKDGVVYPELLNISAVKGKKGHITNFVAVFSEITTMKETQQNLLEANELLTELAVIDALTQIHNRRYFDLELTKEWSSAKRLNKPISLILFDIDYFKQFNDTYGHLSGDDCLKQVADIVKETVKRSTDIVARYGGEEFAIILPDTNQEGAKIVSEEIRRKIEYLKIPNKKSEVSEFVTISVGLVSLFPSQDFQPLDLIGFADQALYRAKEFGRNRVEVYEEKVPVE